MNRLKVLTYLFIWAVKSNSGLKEEKAEVITVIICRPSSLDADIIIINVSNWKSTKTDTHISMGLLNCEC